MSFKRGGLGLLAVLLLWLTASVGAQQNLPPADWYVVLNTAFSDELIWVNANGEQARISRPKVANEQMGPKAQRNILISPEGRYAVLTNRLVNGRTAVSFYDFQEGKFLVSHMTQPGETALLGSRHSFAPALSGVAVAFYTINGPEISDWRMIHFNYKTGSAEKVLQLSDGLVNVPLAAGAGTFPQIAYGTQTGYVFRMIPYATGGAIDTLAYQWTLSNGTVSDPDSLSTESDVYQGNDGGLIEARYEPGMPQVEAAFDGIMPIQNVITTRAGIGQPPTVYHTETTGSFFAPFWARNFGWFGYNLQTPQDGSYWVLRSVENNETFLFEGMLVKGLYGLNDGVLIDYTNGSLVYATQIDGSGGSTIFTSTPQNPARMIYYTPQGAPPGFDFALSSIAGNSSGQASGAPVSQAVQSDPNCAGAPLPKLVIGAATTVTYTDGTPLRVRQQPGGTIITELAEGTPVDVLEGPVCLNSYNWWKISVEVNGGAVLTGWSAEGDMEDYFMAVYIDGGMDSPNAGGPVAITGTSLPPVIQVTPNVPISQLTPIIQINPNLRVTQPPLINPVIISTQPPLIINPAVLTIIGDGNCRRAPAQTIAIGGTVLTQSSGTLAVRDLPTDETPSSQLASNMRVTVLEGPVCHRGLRYWRLQIDASRQGWVADGADGNVYLVRQ